MTAAVLAVPVLLVGVAAPAVIKIAAPAAIEIAPRHGPLSRQDHALIVETLKHASDHGLEPVSTRGLSDAELERAVIAYANAMRGGRMEGRFPGNWAIQPEPYDAATGLAWALSEGQVRTWLESLPPPYEDYRQLVGALARYREIQANGGWEKLETGATLKSGNRDPRIAALRNRLAIENGARLAAADETALDAPLVQALRAEQARLGVPVTGDLDKATVAALNVPVSARIETIKANLERIRWMPRKLESYRVYVNVADGRMAVIRDGATPLSMRVIVGKKSHPTPLFIDKMETVVINPPWNVPTSIAEEEIEPKAAADPGYMASHHFVRTSEGRIQQEPGPDNALGRLKFDFPNRFAVYLHDTPARSLFSRHARALSHGCVRVQEPLELANLILGSQPRWDASAIDDAIATGETKYVNIDNGPQVVIDYRTAFVSGGKVNFRGDVYGWDDKLHQLIAKG